MADQHNISTPPIEQFRSVIASKGITPPDEIIGDGKIHHFSSNGRAGDNKGWYVFHDQDIPAGSFGDFRQYGTSSFPWVADIGREWTRDEKNDYQKKQADLRAKRIAETELRRAEARVKAAQIMAASTFSDNTHPYLVRKDVKAHGVALWDDPILSIKYSKKSNEPFLQIISKDGKVQFGVGIDLEAKSEEEIYAAWQSILIIPMLDKSGEIQSLQFISKNGDKKFLFGGKMQGCYFQIGKTEATDKILIAEGYATAATIHEITGLPVIVAYNAGNLLAVTESIRAQHPSASIVLCADDDFRTKGNPGITKAHEAAAAIGGTVITPVFGDDRPDKATDFNDMVALTGKAAVTSFFTRHFLEGSKPMTSNIDDNISEQAPTITKPANSNIAPASLYDVPDEKVIAGRIVSYGAAPYKFDDTNNLSFYLNIRQDDTTQTLWGLDLERALIESSFDIDDEVVVFDRGKVPVQVTAKIRDAEGRVIRQEPRIVMKGAWHIGPIEEYAEARSQRAKRNQPQPQYTAPEIGNERSEPEQAPPPRTSSHRAPPPYVPLAEPVAQPKKHFPLDEFEEVHKIWEIVPRRTSIHTETGYHLVVDAKRTVVVTKDKITFARKPRHRLDQAYEASCEHARQFWGGQMEVHGDNHHRVKAWAYASIYGVQITNFKPNASELVEAEKIMAELRKVMEPTFSCPAAVKKRGAELKL